MQMLNHITTVEKLQQEKYRVRERLEIHKRELSRKMYEIPAELAAAGANRLIPGFLRGKITNAALSGGKKLINKLVVPGDDQKSALPSISRGITIASGIRKLFSLWRGR
jgi:hypothetical protein